MLNKLENTASPEELIEFEKNTLYIFLLSINNEKLTSRIMGFIANDRISQTIMDRITDGCTRVEKENEVGSLYHYLDVLLCPSGMATTVNERKLDYLNIYLDDILLANDRYHKKSIIQLISVDKESVVTKEGKLYFIKLISQIMEKNKQKVKEIKF